MDLGNLQVISIIETEIYIGLQCVKCKIEIELL